MPEVLEPRWLLLVHQLPARPSNLRVHIWRRLQDVGAIALRNSIYVLPQSSEAREDFEWVRAEIADRGGQVNILLAQAVDGYTDDELEQTFRDARANDYRTLLADTAAARKSLNSKRNSRRRTQRQIAKLRERFRAIKSRDFFGAPGAHDVESAIDALEQTSSPAAVTSDSDARLDPRFFRRRAWVTRPRPGIDRMASAWLVRRFIDPHASFIFGSQPTATEQIPFDMPDVEFGHHGTDCTYETLMRRFGITDPAATRVGQLVHDLDLKDSRYSIPEASTVGRLVEGLRATVTSDEQLIEHGIQVIAALHASFASEHPSIHRRSRRQATRIGRGRAKAR